MRIIVFENQEIGEYKFHPRIYDSSDGIYFIILDNHLADLKWAEYVEERR